MSSGPWLSIIGLGEDGLDGLCAASREALQSSDVVMGPPRHLALLSDVSAERIEWPVPFADGIDRLLSLKGQRVAMLVSGDPFWFGAGTTITRYLASDEWRSFPGRSTFSLVASRLGWPLDETLCLGLHAAPISRIRPHLAPGQRIIVLLSDGDAVATLARYLGEAGFGETELSILASVGGAREAQTNIKAKDSTDETFSHPVCAAMTVSGLGHALPRSTGLDDHFFQTDGVMTKRPIRALTLSALAPKPFEHLWDIGGGSGSISIEWLLAHPSTQATAIETRQDRAALIRSNAADLGVDRLKVIEGTALDVLDTLEPPNAVFIGGGLSSELINKLTGLATGTRLVANAVTLETQSLLQDTQARLGGELMRIDVSNSVPVGGKRAWQSAYPIVQWSHVL